MKVAIPVVVLALLMVCYLLFANTEKVKMQTSTKFIPGQIWEYETRPTEKDSRVLILKTEESKFGWIVHVAITNVKINNPNGKVITHISHIPIREKELLESITGLSGNAESLPDFSEGYKSWKEANGGVFTIQLSEIVSTIEKGIISGE